MKSAQYIYRKSSWFYLDLEDAYPIICLGQESLITGAILGRASIYDIVRRNMYPELSL